MANFNPQINAEIFKDRRVQIGLAVTGLLAVAAVVFFVVVPMLTGPGDQPATAEFPGQEPVAPGPGPSPGFPGGGPGGSPGMPAGPQPNPAPAQPAGGTPAPGKLATSWDGQGEPVTVPPAPEGTGIMKGKKPTATRRDPFVTFYKPPKAPPKPPIPPYVYVVPVRVASASDAVTYEKSAEGPNPAENAPLPYVPRRLSGVLHNGAVSAILETGTPPQADARVISPGARVPSGIPGVPDLVVESITATQAVLRASDNRSVVVRIGNIAPGAAALLRPGMQPGMGSGSGSGPGGFAP